MTRCICRRSVAVGLVAWLLAAAIAIAACIPQNGVPGTAESDAATDGATVGLDTPAVSASVPSERPSFMRPTPTPLPTFLLVVVHSGDTLTSIARTHGTTARSIAFWNRDVYPSLDPDSSTYAPNRIEVGWLLRLVPNVELDPEDLPEPSASG